MSWKDRLRPATFRGVEFKVETRTDTRGRRVIVREYPDSNKTSSRDNGILARTFEIEAYLIGADYDRDSSRLLDACEAEGAATLSLPGLRDVQVRCKTAAATETREEGGLARVTMALVVAGGTLQPLSVIDPATTAAATASEAVIVAQDDYTTRGDISEYPAVRDVDVAGGFAETATSLQALVPVTTTGDTGYVFTSARRSMVSESFDLVGDTSSASTALADLVAAFALTATTSEIRLDRTVAALDVFPAPEVTASPLDAQRRVVRTTLQAERLRALSTASFDSADEARAALDAMIVSIDDDIVWSGSDFADEMYRSLIDLRRTAIDVMTSRAANLAPLILLHPAAGSSLLVEAYRLYGDAARESDLARRNRVAHPGILPPDAVLEALAP